MYLLYSTIKWRKEKRQRKKRKNAHLLQWVPYQIKLKIKRKKKQNTHVWWCLSPAIQPQRTALPRHRIWNGKIFICRMQIIFCWLRSFSRSSLHTFRMFSYKLFYLFILVKQKKKKEQKNLNFFYTKIDKKSDFFSNDKHIREGKNKQIKSKFSLV